MSLEQKSKKELVEIINTLTEKLKEVKQVEDKVLKVEAELKQPALGLHVDEKGHFSLVKIKYDAKSKASTVESIESLQSSDQAIALYKAKQYLVETILKKAKGGKYV